jgi:peptidoglycan hydrolase CwlO-like protein
LKTKQKQLKLQDKGNKLKRACPPTNEEINIVNLQIVRTKTFIRKRRRSIIDIGYGSYFNSFTGEQKHKKVVPEYI